MADDDKKMGQSPDAAASGSRPGETYGDGTPAFAGFPLTKYHPVYGAKTVGDPNEAATVFQPPHNWFDTPGAADMARTDREAQEVIHYNLRQKVDANVAINNGEDVVPLTGDDAAKGIVRNSVQAQESIDKGNAEPI